MNFARDFLTNQIFYGTVITAVQTPVQVRIGATHWEELTMKVGITALIVVALVMLAGDMAFIVWARRNNKRRNEGKLPEATTAGQFWGAADLARRNLLESVNGDRTE